MRCKCCGGVVARVFQIDANGSCEDAEAPVFPPSRTLVTYLRCGGCGFLFTPDFDAWTDADFAARIYNDQHALVDPEFAEARPRYFMRLLTLPPRESRKSLRVFDFGGGAGHLAALLRDAGYAAADCFDPHFGTDAPVGRDYDMVTAFEVFEHSIDPMGSAEQALSYAGPTGFLLFSNQLQPARVWPTGFMSRRATGMFQFIYGTV